MGLLFQIHEQDEAKPLSSKSPPPLLFFLGELSGETKNAICDPIGKTLVEVEFPELSCQIECLASGHGWLLLISREATSVFFFNPLTRQRIDLVYRSCVFNAAAFSAPPTSNSCTVVAIERDSFNGKFNIDVLQVGKDKFWTRFAYSIASNDFGTVMQVLYSNGFLYCVDLQGRISRFDIQNSNWEILSKHKFKQVGGSFLAELNGEIFAVKKGSNGVIEKPYKVKSTTAGANWEEVNDMEGVALLVGPHGHRTASGLDEELQKTVFVAGYEPETKCVKYEFHGGEGKETMKFHVPRFSCAHAPVWI